MTTVKVINLTTGAVHNFINEGAIDEARHFVKANRFYCINNGRRLDTLLLTIEDSWKVSSRFFPGFDSKLQNFCDWFAIPAQIPHLLRHMGYKTPEEVESDWMCGDFGIKMEKCLADGKCYTEEVLTQIKNLITLG